MEEDKKFNEEQFAPYAVEGSLPQIFGRILVANFAPDTSGPFRFGEGVVINSSFESNPIGGTRTALVFKGSDAVIEIGDGTGMSNVMIAAHEKVSIGKDCSLGAGCKIMDTDFHALDLRDRKANINTLHKPVKIGNGVFIGTEAIICKGVTIGDESIVGAGAVVTKNIPAGEIWAGNPAKFIRKLTKDE